MCSMFRPASRGAILECGLLRSLQMQGVIMRYKGWRTALTGALLTLGWILLVLLSILYLLLG